MANPYIGYAQPLEFQKVAPNTSAQEQLKAMLLQQQAQQVAQAGQVPKSGNDAFALAQMLKKDGQTPLTDYLNPYMPWTQLGTANQYGTDPYSQQSLMLAQQNQGF